jgi:hypothetical protein
MADLWVLVPSRGRPKSVDRLVRACALTCQADTRLHFGFDDDDPDLEAAIAATGGHRYTVGPRQGLAAWTNDLAARHVKRADAVALASIGDDMLPITDGWDQLLVAAAGAGFAYPNDLRRADIPEAVVIDARIVEALGWMAHPSMHHWFIDNVWADLGRAAGCLAYLDDVIVEHLHPNIRPDVTKSDGTYHDAARHFNSDLAKYQRWRLLGMQKDVAAVRRVRAAAGYPV